MSKSPGAVSVALVIAMALIPACGPNRAEVTNESGDQGFAAPQVRGREAMGHGAMGATGPGAPASPPSVTDASFEADMAIVHELLMNHVAITRTVVHLPNGIRTVTTSTSPPVAAYLVEHVASMERRLTEGRVFNLTSPTLPVIFENYDRVHTEVEYSDTGVTVVQTSDDPAIVAALQAHAAEVTDLVDEGMMAMMRSMMESQMRGAMPEMGGRGMGMEGTHRP